MSTHAAVPTSHVRGELTFLHVVRSEWIKLRTLRSTVWTLGCLIVVLVGFSLLLSATIPDAETMRPLFASQGGLNTFVTNSATAGIVFAHLIIGVLGVLVISGEFSTGMIRSSFAAEPRRFPVLAAKGIVLALTSFVVGLVSLTLSWVVTASLLSPKGYDADLFASSTLWSILGGSASLALIALFALGVGAILRSTAGSIATVVGILFVLPIIGNIIVSLLPDQKWIATISHYLLDSTSRSMAGGSSSLQPWENTLTVVIWAAVAFILGAVLVQRRDA